uniref:Bri3 binding protein n=1 Tax=Labrus bergylta TaxID=56723 RepID=A0A3Q3FHQ1_9LABR
HPPARCHLGTGRSRTSTQNSFRRAANGIYQTLSNVFGEDNIRGLYKFFSKTTERFVHGVDSFMDTIWKIWSDLLDVMGIDSSNLSHYFSPTPSPTLRHAPCSWSPPYCWPTGSSPCSWGVSFTCCTPSSAASSGARVLLFALSCLYILQKFEATRARRAAAVLHHGPVLHDGARGSVLASGRQRSSLEEKIDHLDTQIRLLNIRLSRVIDGLERSGEQ